MLHFEDDCKKEGKSWQTAFAKGFGGACRRICPKKGKANLKFLF